MPDASPFRSWNGRDSWEFVDGVRIHAEEPELRAEPAPLSSAESRIPRVLVVGVVGVEHQLGPADLDRGEVGIRVVDRRLEHVPVECHRTRHVPHDQVGHERRQHAPVAVPGDPGVGRALLHPLKAP